MKVLCLILLLANIILFVLGNWFGGDEASPPREEINAEKIQRLDPGELPPVRN
jgi:hypothetical protein